MREDVTNEGYTIIERFTVGELGFALGEREAAPPPKDFDEFIFAEDEIPPPPFVIWCYCANNPNHFFWAHYKNRRGAAYDTYLQRINDEVRSISESTGKPFPLPAICMSIEPSSSTLITIKRGVFGYYIIDWSIGGDYDYNRDIADSLNKRYGITKAQEQAMLAAIRFGWDSPAVDPRLYSANGTVKHMKKPDEPER